MEPAVEPAKPSRIAGDGASLTPPAGTAQAPALVEASSSGSAGSSAQHPGAFPLLDGYRAIAAFMVVTTHVAFTTGAIFTPVVGPLWGRMDFGVTLFFLLSGFLLYRPWAKAAMAQSPTPRLGTYALRRAARILPAYWLMVTVTLLLLPEIQPVRWQAWPVHLGLLHIYLPGFTLEGLTQTWSLATEVAFYVALPFIAWLTGRRFRGNPTKSMYWQLGVLGVLVLGSWIFTILRVSGAMGSSTIVGYWLPGFIDWFAIGMAAAVLQTRLQYAAAPRWVYDVQDIARSTAWCLVIGVALFVIAATPIAGPLTFAAAEPSSLVIKHVLYAVTAAFLLLPAFLGVGDSVGHSDLARSGQTRSTQTRSTWSEILQNPVIVYLGTISYGVFLWHLVLLRFIAGGLHIGPFQGGFWILWPLTVLASIVVASVSWFALERPLQRLSHRRRSA